jgi:outer membrane protein OmpA-like peptidoglycan-associated protein
MKAALFSFTILSSSFCNAQTTQWAGKVINYSSQKDYTSFSAQQALDEPNSMPDKGYAATAWEAATDDRREFLHLGFEKPMKIKQVIVAENNAAGAVVKITLYDTQNMEHEIYRHDAETLQVNSRYLQVKFEMTSYDVSAVKVSIDCRAVPGKNQIDAVGIANHHDDIKSEVITAGEIKFFAEPEKLSSNVNSYYTEVGPVIAPDGKTLYFCRKDYPPHTNDDEIWYSVLDAEGKWSKAINIGAPLNTSRHNFFGAITPDGNTALMGNQYFKSDVNASGDGFSVSKQTPEGWSFPENARVKNFVNTDNYVNFYLSNDGKKVFMNVRRNDTRGESDLYISFLLEDGSWSEPKNIGQTINSTGSECCAFLASDDVTLFFSSDGYNGFGSNDIYMSRRLDDTWTNWSEPVNIGPPVNSAGWDAYYTLPAKGDYAYFVRDDDIWRIRIIPELKPKPVMLVYGTVYNQKTKEPVGDAKIKYEFLKTGKEAGIAISTPVTGEYKIVLPYGHNYGFLASAKNYLSVSDNLDASNLTDYTEIKRDLYLVPVEVGQTVRLNNIFFDFAKSTLRSESFPELDRIVKFLSENPSVEIEIKGHTDNVGSHEDNLALSNSRASAVMDYLISKTIPAARLKSQGFGETKPVASNDTDEGRQLNRRVEFTIIKK